MSRQHTVNLGLTTRLQSKLKELCDDTGMNQNEVLRHYINIHHNRLLERQNETGRSHTATVPETEKRPITHRDQPPNE